MKKSFNLFLSIVILIITVLTTPTLVSAATHSSYTSQLTSSEKTVESKILKYIKKHPEKKSYTYTYKVKSSKANAVRKAMKKYFKLYARSMTALYLDYPEYYWLNNPVFNAKGLIIGNKGKVEVRVDFNNSISHNKKTVKAQKKLLNSAYKQIKKSNPKTSSEKITAINEWLCDNVKYNVNTAGFTGYGVLKNKSGVCDGISSAFKMLCKKFKIKCFKVRGYTDGQLHAWNIVKCSGKWLGVDSTWNLSTGRNLYLMQNKKEFNVNHKRMKEVGGYSYNGSILKFKDLKPPF